MNPKELLGQITFANQLTFLRLVATPFLILAILNGRFDIAVLIYGSAAITDLLDGLTARLFQQETALGAYLDPAADKILCTASFLLLTDYPTLFQSIPMANRIPVWLTILTISRDLFIVVVALMLYLAYGTNRFPPTLWGKLTTVAESVCVGLFLVMNQMQRSHWILDAVVWLALALILISGFDYLGRTVRWLRASEPRSRTPASG
jgi:cardiolipin synthase